MRFLHLVLLFLIFATTAQTPVRAETAVAVRSAVHDGYTRLVFDWPEKTGYDLSRQGGRLSLHFAKAGQLGGAVKGMTTLSKPAGPLKVGIEVPPDAKIRDFVVENKIILDVYKSTATAAEKKPTAPKADPRPVAAKPVLDKKPVEVKPPVAVKPTQAAVIEPPKTVSVAEIAKQPVPVSPPAAAPHSDAEKIPEAATTATTITMTGTSNFGLAVYQRSGALWIATDNDDPAIAPQITGPQKDTLPKFIKTDIGAGTLYRLDLPDNAVVKGEGGGLSWRIVFSAPTDDVKPITPSIAAGKLVWPMTNMRKAMHFTDPLVGDQINIVTASSAGNFSGPARRFVNLETLPSSIGIAYIAKSDDVNATVMPQNVTIGRPGGLALSDEKDMKADQIRKEIATPAAAKKEETAPQLPPADPMKGEPIAQKVGDSQPKTDGAVTPSATEASKPVTPLTTEDIAKAGGERPVGNNIYNFNRWEMGGVNVLNDNRHVMMVQISNKKEQERAGDLITLAKLNLANNRASEALGLLRVASQQVPDLEDNAEFIGLRGAANALAGKYDEAVIDYSRDAMKNYDDVKYWRAFTFGGLEDWKQAIAVMPEKFDTIQTYPKPVRTPMVIGLAEIALRAGKVPEALGLLDILTPDIDTLPLPYVAAWKYLKGEAERQVGHADKAEEYWVPLVKEGKDDLYRAKAGLSLTKLQLDQKQIKPAEGIDRLEGLRYAWRGDELETLVNYRLGQMYVGNNDYLKALTVLRNASTLSPESDMAKDVKDYMTKTFRDVFDSGKIQDLSPLDAVGLYQEFKDLAPPGDDGNRYIEKLAERMVNADLLGRAGALLDDLVTHHLQGDKKAEIAIRLAAIRLLDGNPEAAMKALDTAQNTLNEITAASAASPQAPKPDPEKQRQIKLLAARALSMMKKTDDAINILEAMPGDPDVNKLRTDIAWSAGRWEDAATSLNDLIVSEDITGVKPLTDYQRDLILNRAIALNLSNNRVALSNLRDRYAPMMATTDRAKMFDVVTRERRPDMIGSRQAIDGMMSEVDMFKGFLDSYSKMDEAAKPSAPAAISTDTAKTSQTAAPATTEPVKTQ